VVPVTGSVAVVVVSVGLMFLWVLVFGCGSAEKTTHLEFLD
jgi:hypothetical protein